MTRMFVRQLKSVGFVDRGACEGADIIIAKRADSQAEVDVEKREEVAAKLKAVAPEIVAKMDEVARTFGAINNSAEAREQMNQAIWRLQESLCSILNDSEADKESLLQQSIAEFVAWAVARIPSWAQGNAVKAGKTLSAASASQIQQALDVLSALLSRATQTPEKETEDMADKKQADKFDASKLDDATKAHIATIEKRATDAEAAQKASDAKVADLEKRIADVEKKNEAPEDAEKAALASLPESVRKRLLDAESAAKRAEEAAKAERDARLTAEFIAKARTDYAGAPATAEELGVAMKRLSDVATADDVALIDRCLKAFAEMASKANVLTEVGRAAPESTGTSAVERINKRAGELVEKGEFATREQAVSHIVATDRELAAAYRAERN